MVRNEDASVEVYIAAQSCCKYSSIFPMPNLKRSSSGSQNSHEKQALEALEDLSVPGPNVLLAKDGELEPDGSEDAKVKEARNVAFAAAVSTGTTDPLSKSAFVLYACKLSVIHNSGAVRYMILTMSLGAAVAFMCSCGNGYDGSLMTAINGMTAYQNRFNQGKELVRIQWSAVLSDVVSRKARRLDRYNFLHLYRRSNGRVAMGWPAL